MGKTELNRLIFFTQSGRNNDTMCTYTPQINLRIKHALKGSDKVLLPTKRRVAGHCKQTSHKAKKTRKSVRFNGLVKVALKRTSQDEIADAWYSSTEYKQFQTDSKVSLRAVAESLKGSTDAYDPSIHCLRGLENWMTTEVYRKRKEQRRDLVQHVLNQQRIQHLLRV